jgi:hypothetical protein
MTRRQIDPLRTLTDEERGGEKKVWLTPLSRPRMSKNKVEANTRFISLGVRFRQGCGGG